uniref:DUF4406 domain-containing protein n=1 Tax=viral metagenome TaxID=1070528 RepID=A0A6M3L308_9ZZZZ
MNVIYVAGKYRADTRSEIGLNILRAEKVAKRLWSEGWAVVCPHANSAHFDGVVADRCFLEGGIEILTRCDSIYMMKGWQDSYGAMAEHAVAMELDMEIIYE